MTVIGVYPGSFDPPTVAHLAIAEAARDHLGLRRIDLVVSRLPLGKEATTSPTLADRVAVLDEVAATRSWLGVRITDLRLLVDIADGYDAVVMGADKWDQVRDPAWYGSDEARDAALARLPRVLVAPRAGQHPPDAEHLATGEHLLDVSSTLARGGAVHLMVAEAAAFDIATGAWTDPVRYRATRLHPGRPPRAAGP